jgi:hypothetical protein
MDPLAPPLGPPIDLPAPPAEPPEGMACPPPLELPLDMVECGVDCEAGAEWLLAGMVWVAVVH